MANEIDLYNDLSIIEKNIKNAKTVSEKWIWKREYRRIVKEIKTLYPELKWG